MKIIPNRLNRAVSLSGLKIKANSPTLLLAGGIVAGVGATVLACRATLRVEKEVIDQAELELSKVHVAKNREDYTKHDQNRDTWIIYVSAGMRLGKLYGPSLLVGALSITMLTKSHSILKDRNTQLAAAYTALSTAFEQYRGRVRTLVGEEAEEKLRYDLHEVTSLGTDENGRPVKNKYHVAGPDGASIYAKFFDEYNVNWQREAKYNRMFLEIQQEQATKRLRAKGYLFLNDVYDQLGIERTPVGQRAGWIFGNGGDDYVSFGLDNDGERARAFMMGHEPSILLDFNVDGDVLAEMEAHS